MCTCYFLAPSHDKGSIRTAAFETRLGRECGTLMSGVSNLTATGEPAVSFVSLSLRRWLPANREVGAPREQTCWAPDLSTLVF